MKSFRRPWRADGCAGTDCSSIGSTAAIPVSTISLPRLSSRKRKAIRKERAAAVEGLEIVALRGAEIEPAHWDAMWEFYQHTGARKWGRPYLTRAFFDRAGEAMGDSALMFLALADGQPIAGALNFIGADTLYGRYWGAIEERPFLHFELSYYRAIELVIAHGLNDDPGRRPGRA